MAAIVSRSFEAPVEACSIEILSREELQTQGIIKEHVNDCVRRIHRVVDWSHYDSAILFAPDDGKSGRLFFARLPGQRDVVGYICIGLGGDEVYVTYLATSNQKKGVGSALLQRAISYGQDQGKSQLLLHCREKVCGFYDKFFKKVGFEEKSGCVVSSFTKTPEGTYRNGDRRVFYRVILPKKAEEETKGVA